MEAHILEQSKDTCTIRWHGATGDGHLLFRYIGHGKFEIDTEYVGLENTLKIIKAAVQK